MDLETIKQKAAAVKWFHSMDLSGGKGDFITQGHKSPALLMREADEAFRFPLEGRSVLDVGAWDGWFSFEAKRRGAERVLATDHWSWTRHATKNEGFKVAREALGLKIEDKQIDVLDISPETVGTFDVVLFMGVFYHLKNPFLAIEQLGKVCNEVMVLETHIVITEEKRPMMIFYPLNDLHNDYSNWWGPNAACVEDMLKVAGFKEVKSDIHPDPRNPKIGRIVSTAYKWKPEEPGERIVLVDGNLRRIVK